MRIYRRGDRELHIHDGKIWIMLMRPRVGGGYFVKDNLFIDLPWR